MVHQQESAYMEISNHSHQSMPLPPDPYSLVERTKKCTFTMICLAECF